MGNNAKTSGTYGIVPARGGSKGVPGKNIRTLGGHPLIAYSIAAGMMSEAVDRVIVSTDSEEIAEISRSYGAEVPFMRPPEISTDTSPDRDFVLHALDRLAEHEGRLPTFLVHLRPTTPLRDPDLVTDAVRLLSERDDATSLRSAHEAPESPYKWFLQDDAGYLRGFLPDDPRPGASNLPRQMFPSVYIPDGYVDVLRTSFVLSAEDIHGDSIFGFVSPQCHEVDTPEVFDLLELQLERAGSPLLTYLNNHKMGA